MTLLIACLLIYSSNLHWTWYIIAGLLWVVHAHVLYIVRLLEDK